MAKGRFDGKGKGKSYENKTAAKLHDLLMENSNWYLTTFKVLENDAIKPKRDASSGTYKDSDGDIALNLAKKIFPFSIECKHRRDLNLSIDQLLKNGGKLLRKVLDEQANGNAERAGLTPLIVFSGNRTGMYAYFDISILTKFPENYIMLEGEKVICFFEDFVKHWIKENDINV